MTERDKLRFWEKVEKKEGCWGWRTLRSIRREPFRARFQLQGRGYPAARVMWLLTNGEIPNKLFVLHRCDNPECVNPKHLFLGTHKENMEDKVRKGRARWRKREDKESFAL